MACLLKRGGVWTVRVFLEGRNRWRSLRTGDRQEAERGAREIEAAIKGQQWVRSQLDELLARATREARPDEAPLLCESVAAALWRLLELVPADRRDPLAPALSRSLVEQQRRKLALADGWFHELDESAVLTYADDLWAAQLTPRTFNAHVPFLRSLWGTLRVAAGLGTDNPWAGFKAKATTADTGRRNLTPAELRAVIGAATGSLRLLLLAGALTGARLGDIASMRRAHLDLAARTWSFTPMKTSRTGTRLVLPLIPPLLDELRAAPAEALSPYVFPRRAPALATGRPNQGHLHAL